MKTILIDADILVYRVGFSSQKTYYCVEDKDTGFGYELTSIKEARTFETDITTRVERMSAEFAANRLKEIIKGIQKGTKCKDYKLYLTGKDNFRDSVAVSYPYKGNRHADKPLHYNFLRSLLVGAYGAEVINGQEADDALGIDQTDSTVIATIDKDLLMIPGSHYNINTGTNIEATDPGELRLEVGAGQPKLVGTGFKWFCAQMLTGDAADNIKGVHRVGGVKAYKVLDKIKHPYDMWTEVEYIYKIKKMSDRLEENALLLWIRREEDQHPYEYIDKLKGDYIDR